MQLTRPSQPQTGRTPGRRFKISTHGRLGYRRVPHRPHTLLLSALVACVLTGCSLLQPHSDPTRFYVLTVQSPSPKPAESTPQIAANRWKVGLRQVEVPAYLRSKAIVIRTGANEVYFADFDRWAEPLDQGISRVMKEALGSTSNVAEVTLNSHGDETLDCEVAIRVLACEGVRVEHGTNSIRFAVTWQVRSLGKNPALAQHGVFAPDAAPWDGKDYGRLAEGLSEAIARLSTTIAASLPVADGASDKTITGNAGPRR